jgi:hypothetical protein
MLITTPGYLHLDFFGDFCHLYWLHGLSFFRAGDDSILRASSQSSSMRYVVQ